MRGGTSKGLYLLEKDLPPKGKERDAALLRLMGSPDIRQIDGLGGATSVTSKAAIVAPSQREDADVDYTFAQVSIQQPTVSYAGNCGNISSGVGPFAIESGLVKAVEGRTEVRIYNTNTKKVMVETVCVENGKVCYEGTASIPGVPGTAAPVLVEIEDPSGSVCGKLLPTGHVTDRLAVEDVGMVEVSIVDAANPLVFVRAADVGMTGRERPMEIDSDETLLKKLEAIRGEAARVLGFVECADESARLSPGVPKMTIVSPAADYETESGVRIQAEEMDIQGRMMSMQKAHQTYALTGAMCTAAAAAIPGTVVWEMVSKSGDRKNASGIRIAHPGGIMEAGVVLRQKEGQKEENQKLEDQKDCENKDETVPEILRVYGVRTARLLMKGTAYI